MRRDEYAIAQLEDVDRGRIEFDPLPPPRQAVAPLSGSRRTWTHVERRLPRALLYTHKYLNKEDKREGGMDESAVWE